MTRKKLQSDWVGKEDREKNTIKYSRRIRGGSFGV